VRIRPAGPDDLEAVVALVAEVDRGRGEEFDEAAFRSLIAEAVLFVAEADGGIVGNLGIHGIDGVSASIGMSVATAWRRRGVGTALIEAAAEWARAHTLGRLTLEVLADNAAALALYRKVGFVEERRRFSKGREIVIMALRP
jgi:RimJ/RimL family protein N-acetyltransferase